MYFLCVLIWSLISYNKIIKWFFNFIFLKKTWQEIHCSYELWLTYTFFCFFWICYEHWNNIFVFSFYNPCLHVLLNFCLKWYKFALSCYKNIFIVMSSTPFLHPIIFFSFMYLFLISLNNNQTQKYYWVNYLFTLVDLSIFHFCPCSLNFFNFIFIFF